MSDLDVRNWSPRGRMLENVEVLRGTARHESHEQIDSWRNWIGRMTAMGVTSHNVIRDMEAA